MAGLSTLYTPMTKLRTMLSNSATFQTITGSADATAALERIKFVSAADFDKTTGAYTGVTRPRAVIWMVAGGRKRVSTSGWFSNPRLILSLEIDIPTATAQTHHAELQYCGPLFEAIENEVFPASKTPGDIDVAEINYLQPPLPADEDKQDGIRYWGMDLEVVCQG